MLTITFKPQFEQKLKELGVRQKFIDNIVTLNKGDALNDKLEMLEDEYDFEYFIALAFVWSQSLEGFDFWDKISEYDL